MALGDILGGISDYFTGQAANEANIRRAEIQRDDAARAREEARKGATGITPDRSTTLNPTGGFNIARRGAEKILGEGDKRRAEESNFLTSNFQPTFPTLQSAIRNAQAGVNQQREAVTKLGEDLALRQNRDFGGIGNTGQAGAMAQPMADIFSKLPIAADVGRKNFNEQNIADAAFQTAQLKNLLPQAKPLIDLPYNAATAIPASIPMQPPASNLEAALGPQNIGSVIKQIGQREERDEQRDRDEALLKQILAARVAAPTTQTQNQNLLNRHLRNQFSNASPLTNYTDKDFG